LYSGEQFDSKIGQQYLRARYYDPATGIFNRLDPFFGNLDDPQSLHKYLYTYADPVNGIDPSGMFGVGGAMAGAALASSVVSMKSSVDIIALEAVIATIDGVQAGMSASQIMQKFFKDQILSAITGFVVVKAIQIGVPLISDVVSSCLSILTSQRSSGRLFNRPLIVINRQNGIYGLFRSEADIAVAGRNATRSLGTGSDRWRLFKDPYQREQVEQWASWLDSKNSQIKDPRINQWQVGVDGKVLGRNVPDLQFTLTGGTHTLPNGATITVPAGGEIRIYVEFDNMLGGAQFNLQARRGTNHLNRILANDPERVVILDRNNSNGQIRNTTIGPIDYVGY
jgi:RHS repeat-associated protein